MLHRPRRGAPPTFLDDADGPLRRPIITSPMDGKVVQDAQGRQRMFGRGKTSLSRILLLVAVIVFVAAAIGIDVSGISLVPIGLALGFGSFLVP
jgi:hypothetical protein